MPAQQTYGKRLKAVDARVEQRLQNRRLGTKSKIIVVVVILVNVIIVAAMTNVDQMQPGGEDVASHPPFPRPLLD